MNRLPLILLAALPLGSCSDAAFLSADKSSGDTGWGGEAGAYDADSDADTDADSDVDDGYGSEDESNFLKLTPAATNAYVFVANPDRDTVTRVSVADLSVITAEVGLRPAVALTTPDYSKAVTFNAGSDDVSVIDAATMEVTTVEVRENFNQMVMSPDGTWVACYHDSTYTDEEEATGGAQSFNELSLVNLNTYEHVPLVVGSNPHGVQFTNDSSTAVVISDDYLAVIPLLDGPPAASRVPIADDLIDPPAAEEVILAPTGTYALVRQYAATTLKIVDLSTLAVSDLDVGDNPTDLDVTPDGTHVVAVARGSSELWIYDLEDIEAPPDVLEMPPEEVFGSIVMSPDNSKALLYSTQTGLSRYASWDRSDDSITVRSLVKPVSSVGVSPTGGTALIFHDKDNGSDMDEDSPFIDAYALSLIDLDDFFSAPLKLPAAPTAYDNTEDGENGMFIMEGEPYLVTLDYETLLYDEVSLKSDPVNMGVLPDTRTAYVSQEHDLGRISFYNLDEKALQTITGFELNSGIDEY